jgi:hypothetical protein
MLVEWQLMVVMLVTMLMHYQRIGLINSPVYLLTLVCNPQIYAVALVLIVPINPVHIITIATSPSLLFRGIYTNNAIAAKLVFCAALVIMQLHTCSTMTFRANYSHHIIIN